MVTTTEKRTTERPKSDFSLLIWSQENRISQLEISSRFIESAFAVATVLNQEPGKLKIKELREGKQ